MAVDKITGPISVIELITTTNSIIDAIPTSTTQLTNDSGYITGVTSKMVTDALGFTPYSNANPSGYQANVIETIKVNGTAQTVSSKAVDITVPTNTTQLVNGSGYITGITSSMVTSALGFTPYNSTNPSGYQANVIETIKVNGTAQTVSSKAVNITVPTSTTQLTNDSGFLTSSDVTSTYSSTGTAPVNGKAVASAISNKADKATSLAGYGITDAYTKTEVDGLVASVYKPAGSVAFASLPTLSASVLGNVYNVTDAFTTTANFVEGAGKDYPANTNVVVVDVSATSTPSYKFDVLSGFVDLSAYQKSETAVTHTKNTAVGSASVPVYISSTGVATTCMAIPTSTTQLTNDSGYITGITSSMVTTALGFTPMQSNAAITGATNCKITYDSKGLVTSGTTLATTDIPNLATNKITVLTGYTIATAAAAIAATDSLNTALGKLQKSIDGKQANIIETVKVNGTALTPSNKTVSITVPTSTTQLTNDSGYITGITSANVTSALGYTPAATFTTTNPSLTASNSVCTWNVTHNVGDTVSVHVYNNTTKKEVLSTVTLTSSTVAKVELFSTSNIASGAYKVVVVGK